MAQGEGGGRPLKFQSVEELRQAIKSGKYDDADKEAEMNAKFSDTIKKAKLKIYADTENSLYSRSSTGAIFSLKNNYGWQDKKEVQHTGNVRVLHQLSDEELNERIEAYNRRRHTIDGTVSGSGQA